MLITKSRAIAAAVVTALALTSFAATPASARSRHHNNAAAIAAFAGIFGTMAALAARDRYRDRYHAAPYGHDYRGPVHVAPRWHGWRHHRHWHR